jgi:hypothetical protein
MYSVRVRVLLLSSLIAAGFRKVVARGSSISICSLIMVLSSLNSANRSSLRVVNAIGKDYLKQI